MLMENIPTGLGLDMTHILLPWAIFTIVKELYIASKHDSIMRQPIYISAYY